MKKEVLRMERVTYLEQGNVKLKNFNMALYEGEIMGLVPMNNLGLDALLQLLQKNLPLYYGYVYYRNHMVNCWGKPKQEWNRISIIRNESILADDMTVADNIFVLRPGFKKWLIQKKVLHRQLAPFLEEIGMDISADAYVSELTHFEKVVVELLKAVVAGHYLIVLYDISTFVSDRERIWLYEVIRYYAAKGISFLYITAHYEETKQLCGRTAMFTNGRIIKYLYPENASSDERYLCRRGGFDKKLREKMKRHTKEGTAFALEALYTPQIQGLSFIVAGGECLVLQDLDNRIWEEFVEALTGEKKPEGGKMLVEGKELPFRYDRRIAVIQEFPAKRMLLPYMSYLDNLCFTLDHRLPGLWRSRRMRESIYRECEAIQEPGLYQGGVDRLTQRQKYDLVYGRILLQNPKVVFCIQPFHGAEMPLRIHICELLEKLLDKGIAVVILAVNLADSLALADRLIKVKDGMNYLECSREEFEGLPDHVPWKSF